MLVWVSSIKAAKALCNLAIGPFSTEKRAPDSLTPISKSKPKGSPSATWSNASKPSGFTAPPKPSVGDQRRSSWLSDSPPPTGTSSCGKLGTPNNKPCNCTCNDSSSVAELSSSSLMATTWAITASAGSPLDFNWPTCLLKLLRCACSSSVRNCTCLRVCSKLLNASTSRNGCGLLRFSRVATTAAKSLRRETTSNMEYVPQK